MTELEEIRQAFEKWARQDRAFPGQYPGRKDAAELFYPFLAFYIRQKEKGMFAEDYKLLYRLKKELGMNLMAHEAVNE